MNTKTYFELLDKAKVALEELTVLRQKYHNYIETPVIGENGRWLLSDTCKADYEDVLDAFSILQNRLQQFKEDLSIELVEEFRNVQSNSK